MEMILGQIAHSLQSFERLTCSPKTRNPSQQSYKVSSHFKELLLLLLLLLSM